MVQKRFRVAKVLLSVIITLSMLLSGVAPAFAMTTDEINERADEYAQLLYYIDQKYMGGTLEADKLQDAALKGLFSELDEYSEYMTKEEYAQYKHDAADEFTGVGLEIKSLENGDKVIAIVMEDSPALAAGVRVGDIITHIDDEDVKLMSNEYFIKKTQGKEGSVLNITVKRGGESKQFHLKRTAIHRPSVSWDKIGNVLQSKKFEDNQHIAYVKITMFSASVATDFKKFMQFAKQNNIKKVILDLRDNPGGFFEETLKICDLIIPKSVICYLIDSHKNTMTFSSDLIGPAPFQFYVLTNEYTASASELLTSAIKESGTGISIGKTTFGKGIGQETIEMDGGRAVKMTVIEYLTGAGKKVHKIGIAPDIKLEVPDYFFAQSTVSVHAEQEDILKLNTMLAYLGYPIKDANAYADETVRAVKDVQKTLKMTESGIADIDTVMAVNGLIYAKSRPADLEKDAFVLKAYESAMK